MSIQEFKQIHKCFTEALRYLIENEKKLKSDPHQWEVVKKNFETKFEQPMDEAWEALTKEEKKRLAPLYLFRKAASDETVKKVLDTFKGRIISVEEK
jgi:hypothetical protein